jgi:hypothetical protein
MNIDQETVQTMTSGLADGRESAVAMFGMEPAVLAQLVEKAEALIAAGKLEEAEGLLVDLADLMPTGSSVPCLLGDLRLKRGDVEGALTAFDLALGRATETTAGEVVQLAHIGRARAWLQLEHPLLARVDFEIACHGDDQKLSEFARMAAESIDVLNRESKT